MKTSAVEYLEKRIAPATIFVTNLNDDLNAGSLRKAIADANATAAPDTIIFKPTAFGTIVLGGTDLEIAAPLTIKGPGAGKVVISGNNLSRIFNVDNANAAIDAPVTLSGLVLTKGNAVGGGNGGGIFGTNGGKVVSKSVNFQGNSASLNGGGISISGTGINATKLEISGGIFRGNSASRGGAVDTAGDGTIAIKGAKFNSNKTTSADGGALYLRTTTTASITSCLFTGNSSADDGGAIVLGSPGTFTLKGISVLGNSANDDGGGLAVFSSAVVKISSSTIKNNTSHDDGGGIHFVGASMEIKTSIITGNVTGRDSGGIYQDGGIITLATTAKLFGNTAPANPDKNF